MGKTTSSESNESNDKTLLRVSNESNERQHLKSERVQMKGFKPDHLNSLPPKERDYMITMAMKRCGVTEEWKPVIAKGANYIHGNRFWIIVEYAQKAHNPARYLIKALNAEMWKKKVA